ncbi:hypothetical protein BVIET440_50055 [Burkholderia vietnamiensis]|nr:hypothetical protein BVI2075_530118 [Burkholderia vietnamiensis]CAG9234957.1 hypothetical protein BVI434_980029 [Burkholderia vietnamiensis]
MILTYQFIQRMVWFLPLPHKKAHACHLVTPSYLPICLHLTLAAAWQLVKSWIASATSGASTLSLCWPMARGASTN